MVGNVGVGGNNPIRIQSMTTSSTRDVEATIDQIIRLADAGCEVARVTVQGMKEADACEGIKNGLLQKGYTIPVVADIHFILQLLCVLPTSSTRYASIQATSLIKERSLKSSNMMTPPMQKRLNASMRSLPPL